MRKAIVTIIVVLICILSIGAERNEPLQNDGYIDFEAAGFQMMHTTAYCMGHHTANGSKVHTGGCACNPHLGDVAIVYTIDGKYLGIYECNDKGGTDGLKAGTVIDVYRPTYTMCESWMKLTGGKVYVLWIEGNG